MQIPVLCGHKLPNCTPTVTRTKCAKPVILRRTQTVCDNRKWNAIGGNQVRCRWTQAACDNHRNVGLCEIRWFLDGHSLSVTIVNGTELCKIRCFSDGQIALVTIIKESRTTGMWFSTIPRRAEVAYGNRENNRNCKTRRFSGGYALYNYATRKLHGICKTPPYRQHEPLITVTNGT